MANGHSKKMGYKNPPVEHRFSATNQPRRRRKKCGSGNGTHPLQYLVDALDQTIEVTKKGKPTKVSAMEAVAQQLVIKTLQGSPSEQRKLFEFLSKNGYLDFVKYREELEESQAQKLAEQDAEYSKLAEFFAETVAIAKTLLHQRQLVGEAFLVARKKCSCGSFDQSEELICQVEEWLVEEDEEGPEKAGVTEGALSWTPGRSAGYVSEEHCSPSDNDSSCTAAPDAASNEQDDDKDDPFYEGMINNKN